MDNKGRFKEGIQFEGNVNCARCEVVKITQGRDNKTACAVIKDLKTGRQFTYGLHALERCDVTIL